MWVSGMRKKPNLTAADIAACVPIGLMASLSHAGSVLAVSNDVI
jgi:solute carrier family 35 protein E1